MVALRFSAEPCMANALDTQRALLDAVCVHRKLLDTCAIENVFHAVVLALGKHRDTKNDYPVKKRHRLFCALELALVE